MCIVLRHQGKLETLEEQFDSMHHEQLHSPAVGMVCLALVKTDLEDDSSVDVLLRARLEEVSYKEASCRVLCNL